MLKALLFIIIIFIFIEATELVEDIDGRSDFKNSTAITVSFNQWNQLMPGVVPPTGWVYFIITCENGGSYYTAKLEDS